MNLLNRLAALAAVALLGAAPGDRPGVPGRVAGGPAAPASRAGALPGPFTLFGWVSPPASVTTEARVAEMAGAGLNLAMPAWNDSGRVRDNLARLDWAAGQGMRCLLWDARFDRFDSLDPGSPEGGAVLDSIVADYRGHPAFFGFAIGDEPPRSMWPLLRGIYDGLRRRDPDHPVWNNLLGPANFTNRDAWMGYVRDYLAQVQPGILCDDYYEFFTAGNRGQFVENAAGLNAMAREAGLPFWSIVLIVQHGSYRAVTPGELAWQTSMLLAYGARGIGYFTYWTPAPDTFWKWQPAVISYEGERTGWYPVLQELNRKVRPVGEALAGLTWLATGHAGGTPAGGTPFAPDGVLARVDGRAALGHFVDAEGTRYVLLANADSSFSQTVGLTLAAPRRVWRMADGGGDWRELAAVPAPHGERVDVALDAGGCALLRLDGPFAPLGAGRGPGLTVAPRPARGVVRLEVSGARPAGQLEILDLHGRRLRSWRLGSPAATLSWYGESDSGGTVPPGVYFARAEDTRGVTVARLQWLGRH